MKKTIVMKFGGASVASPQHFSKIADIILERLTDFSRLAIVVSAMGDTTNQLISLAKQVRPNPPTREYAGYIISRLGLLERYAEESTRCARGGGGAWYRLQQA